MKLFLCGKGSVFLQKLRGDQVYLYLEQYGYVIESC